MANLGWTEILIILAIILLLFGANKLPDLARSMGRSARIFKSEVKEMRNDDAVVEAAAPTDRPAELPKSEVPQTNQETKSAETFWDRPENQPR
ncbi:Sec-independent protein translocase protein TatAd [Corynebacterium capitovis DSM 44611]|uniref:Sec-independent protein translocase subunit TatA n=1 Tax=Corynebacterium capitovis TaxID=131081 RepID=UPI00036E6A13|nr:Sec-independent protein translocase subunit TatA [Corynebacterium capitovis]WKD57682.1 Sec-independent protein translocase protein TatAd [Corynebacterium capitovis DSM 44611]